MATLTKTFKENRDGSSSTYSTWTISATHADMTITTDRLSSFSYPTLSAKYSAISGKNAINLYVGAKVYVGTTELAYSYYATSTNVKLAGNTAKSFTAGDGGFYTNAIFSSSNPTVKSVPVLFKHSIISLMSGKYYDAYSFDAPYGCYETETEVSWGTLFNITLNAPPTFSTPTVSKDKNGWYSNITTMTVSVPISYSSSGTSATAKYGGYVSKIAVTVGSQTVTKTYTESTKPTSAQTLSLLLNNAGTFTPTVSVTDSRGQTTTVSLSEITVLPYSVPSVNFDVYRTDASGVKADEGTYGLIEGTIDYTSAVTNLVAPSVKINGTTTNNVSWYSDRALTTAITNWANVVSGATVYGLINGSFAETTSYEITLTAEDALGSESTPITQTLSTAFYTIDFQAGGKEIAFGAPANDDLTDVNGKDYSDIGLFKCNMGALFENDAVITNPYYSLDSTATSGTTDGDLYAVITALGWASDVIENVKLNVKKLFTKILVNISNLNSTAIVGATTNYTTISVTNDTVFTCSKTGWLVCTLTTNSGQTIAPYVGLELYDSNNTNIGLLASAWGITTNGATITVQAPVQSGQKYRIHAVRCSISTTRIYH